MIPGKLYLTKQRDTFHLRGALKRLGLRFDGDERLWYADTQAQIDAALKLLREEREKQFQAAQAQHAADNATGETDAASSGAGKPTQAEVEANDNATQADAGKVEQCQDCGFTGGEHSKACNAGKAQGSGEGEGEPDDTDTGSDSEGEPESEGEQGEQGEGDAKPFATFAVASIQSGMQAAAQAADAVLAKAMQGMAQSKQQQQQAQAQQAAQAAQAQQAMQKMQRDMQAKVAEVTKAAEAAVKQAAEAAQAAAPQRVHIVINDAAPVELEGEIVPEIVGEVVARLKAGKHVRLVGPAGSGKSEIARIASKVMEYRFGFINFSEGADESHLYGFRDITEKGTVYVVPELSFADCYENGGLWLGDEYDRANPNVIVSLNGALANGHLSLPKRQGATQARRHEKFACIVTMNTWGTGPNAAYTSANRLDASSLDRFRVGTIYVDYNRKLEAALMPDKDLLAKLWALRDKVMALGMQRVVSTRFIKDAADCQAALGWTHDKVMMLATQDWSTGDKQKVGLD